MLVSINVVTLRRAQVSAWIDDCFRTDKPPPRRPGHPGQLSLSHPSMDRHSEYPAKAEVNRHTTSCTSLCSWSHSVGWCLAEDYFNGDEWLRIRGCYTNPRLLYLLYLRFCCKAYKRVLNCTGVEDLDRSVSTTF